MNPYEELARIKKVDAIVLYLRQKGSIARHCAGALIFAEKHENATQMMRISERLGMYDARKLDNPSFRAVFDSFGQMMATALDHTRQRRTARRKVANA